MKHYNRARAIPFASTTRAAIIVLALGGCPSATTNPEPGGPVELNVELEVPNEGNSHFSTGTDLDYDANPPASGPHWPNPVARGYYETPVAPEQWVHNLEHGYVVILFDCHGPCDEGLLLALEGFAASAPASSVFGYSKIVVTPYDGLPENALLAVIAWDVQLFLDRFDEQVLLDFFNRYQDQGPERAG